MATVVKTAVTSCMSIDQSSSEAIDRWSCAIIPPKRALSPLREGICSQCAELGHADILLCDEAGSHLGVATPRPSRRALASAPQDEEGLRMPWMIYLILRSGHRPRLAVRDAALRRLLTMRGRTTPMHDGALGLRRQPHTVVGDEAAGLHHPLPRRLGGDRLGHAARGDGAEIGRRARDETIRGDAMRARTCGGCHVE